jgi:hypothetical protein
MANFTTPPYAFPFVEGEAAYLLPTWRKARQPTPLIPVRITETNQYMTVVERENGRRSGVCTSSLSYRGYCATCPSPVVVADGRLVCPHCGTAAIDQPPPDALVVRWFPTGRWGTSMIMHRAVLYPDWSWRMAADDVEATVESAYQGMLTRLRLERDIPNGSVWGLMLFYAMIGDAQAFLNTYWHQTYDDDRSSFYGDPIHPTRSHLLPLAGDGPGGPSRRLQLPRLSITRPIGDCEPDGEDEMTRWLERQFKKAA